MIRCVKSQTYYLIICEFILPECSWLLYHIKDSKRSGMIDLASFFTKQKPAVLTGVCRHFISTVYCLLNSQWKYSATLLTN